MCADCDQLRSGVRIDGLPIPNNGAPNSDFTLASDPINFGVDPYTTGTNALGSDPTFTEPDIVVHPVARIAAPAVLPPIFAQALAASASYAGCSAATPQSYRASTPWGPVALPTILPGSHITYGFLGADAAAGFGLGGNVGEYTYTNSRGVTVTGLYAAPALAVGAGAAASLQVGESQSLNSFFGNSASVSASFAIVGLEIAGNLNGFSASGGLSAGARIMGESSFAFPIGTPWAVRCKGG